MLYKTQSKINDVSMTGVHILFVLFIVYSFQHVCEADDVDLYITADSTLEAIWVDGGSYTRYLSNNRDWRFVDTIRIPSDTQLIAVRASDTAAVAGVLVSLSDNSLVTHNSWKCTTTYFPNWMLTTFDDASWPNAVKVNDHKTSDFHGVLPYISTDADWIWTTNHGLGTSRIIDRTVYCRGHREHGDQTQSQDDDDDDDDSDEDDSDGPGVSKRSGKVHLQERDDDDDDFPDVGYAKRSGHSPE